MIDFLIVCSNTYAFIELFLHSDEEDHSEDHKWSRMNEALLIVSLLIKCLYFMKMNPSIAALINIISKITYDIRYFMMIFIIVEIAFIMAYYCFGKNQQDLALE